MILVSFTSLSSTHPIVFKKLEQNPKCRRLPLESFLAAPTTRLAKSKLLLETILKYTPQNHPDTHLIPQAISHMKTILENINIATGKADNRFKLDQLADQLTLNSKEAALVNLSDSRRQLVRDGPLIMKKTASDYEVHVFLLDNCLLICKRKKTGQLKLYKNVCVWGGFFLRLF